MHIYEQLIEAGVELDHHESDLYARVNFDSINIVSKYVYRDAVTKFMSPDGSMWFDIPFAFLPFWLARV